MRAAVIAAGMVCAVVVAAAAGVFLYERASLRSDRTRLREVRLELNAAVSARQDREHVLDAKSPGRPLELLTEKRARYGADATWRELERKVTDRETEILTILDRWPELR